MDSNREKIEKRVAYLERSIADNRSWRKKVERDAHPELDAEHSCWQEELRFLKLLLA